MRRLLLPLVLAASLLAACTSGETPSPEPTASALPQPTPTVTIGLAELGIDDWPSAQPARFGAAPAAPAGVAQADYRAAVAAVKVWAAQAVNQPTKVGTGLPNGLDEQVASAAAGEPASAVALGNVLDPALEVMDSRLTSAWDVTTKDGATTVALQTRAAYEVRLPGGPTRVIGVLRTQGVVLVPGTTDWGTATGWQEFGAADCAVALDDFLTPGGDADDQQSDLSIFVEVGNGDEVVTPTLPEDEQIDQAFVDQCEAGRV